MKKLTMYQEYAAKYGMTTAQAIGERDHSADRAWCINTFIEAEGRQPTEEEIQDMAPSSEETLRECEDRRHPDLYR